VPLAETSSTYRWCLFEWNLLGEAAMPVWIPAGAAVEERPAPNVGSSTPYVGPTVVRGVLNLQSTIYNQQSDLALLNAAGRKVMELQPGANDVRHLAPGVYYIVPGPNSGHTQKIIKTGKD